MIRFSAFLVAVAVGLLVAGVVTSRLMLVYAAIGVSGVALLALAIGALIKRRELFGQPESAQSQQTLSEPESAQPEPAVALVAPGQATPSQSAVPASSAWPAAGTAAAAGAYRAADQPAPSSAADVQDRPPAPRSPSGVPAAASTAPTWRPDAPPTQPLREIRPPPPPRPRLPIPGKPRRHHRLRTRRPRLHSPSWPRPPQHLRSLPRPVRNRLISPRPTRASRQPTTRTATPNSIPRWTNSPVRPPKPRPRPRCWPPPRLPKLKRKMPCPPSRSSPPGKSRSWRQSRALKASHRPKIMARPASKPASRRLGKPLSPRTPSRPRPSPRRISRPRSSPPRPQAPMPNLLPSSSARSLSSPASRDTTPRNACSSGSWGRATWTR